mgnify:CR=1 FL=1|tara:strand:- start:234 stop:515 length:282 start_codon:yes stop_codon:yes gene_type:complete
MKKQKTEELITAPISLTKEQWALLTVFTNQSIPMLPRNCWDVGEEIEKAIEKGLENPISKDTQISIESMRHSLKTQRNDIHNLNSQIKKLKGN